MNREDLVAAQVNGPPPLPEGTVTLVLGDVEGSVGMWEADREAMAAAVRRLDETVSRTAAEHRGVRPVEQGEGDSFVLAFERASEAVVCALDLQRTIAAERWPGTLRPRVRIGVHTGEVEVRRARLYEGPAINRCARLRDLGHGGQVLLSQATHDVVVDRLPDGTWLEDLGRHTLRGFARPEHVYALRAEDLPGAFPSLRAQDPDRGRLPVPLTTLVGREEESRRVRELLGRGRLVTLTGAGGAGKTRLATAVVHDIADTFDAGAWWIDLAPLSDADLVASTVAAGLAVRESTSEDVVDTLVRELDDRRLVVLDNCEHLVAACADLVARLLAGCPRVVVLTTSREPLGVEGEVIYRVPSLPTPEDEPTTIEALRASAAARLFLDRAALARPDARYTDRDAPAIGGICRRLDGIPLAIELAAARTRLMTPAQIVEGLADRFHLLTGGARTAMPRQRTLEASVDWSYHLLDPPQRALLARLSVFVGSFGLDAATEVCAGDPIDPARVLDLLSHLVDRSLVQVEDTGDEARYRLLETLRVYARQKLADSGQAAAFRDRHLDHYVALAETAADHLRSPEAPMWFARLDAELGNLRAAMDWALAAGQPEKQLRLSGTLLVFWSTRSLYAEIRLRMVAALDSSHGDPAIRARALSSAALVSLMAGENRTAKALAREGVELSRRLDDARSLAQCLMYLGWSSYWLGDHGLEHVEEALRLAEALDDPLLRRLSWFYGAVLRQQLLDLERAADWFDRASQAAAEAGDRYAEGVLAFFRGAGNLEQGRLPEAAELLDRAVSLNRTIGNETFVVFSASALAYVEALRGRLGDASTRIDELRGIARRTGLQAQLFADAMEGGVLLVAGDLDSAAQLLAAAAAGLRTAGNIDAVATCLWLAAEASSLRGDLESARPAVRESLTVSDRGGFRWSAGHARRIAGRLALLDGDLGDAADLLHAALEIVRDRDDPLGTVQVLEALAEVASAGDDHARAARLLGAASAESARRGFARIPQYGQVLEAVLERARDALGDEGFQAAWDEGGALPLAEAVAYAHRGRGERRRPDTGWRSLTPAELDVAHLVGEGLSNPQIAERLFVSRNTVKSHLSSVYTKLGISSRSQLAAQVTRRLTSPSREA